MSDPIQTMLDQLTRIRDLYGEDKFRYAAAHSVRMILAKEPEREAEIREALKDVDLDDLLQNPPSFAAGGVKLPTEDAMIGAIRQSMPGIQTQAQLDVVLTAFDSLKTTLNGIFLGEKDRAQKGREALLQALITAEKVTELSVKLGQVPEAATSSASAEFKNPPLQFTERDTLEALMLSMESIQSSVELQAWYVGNRKKIDEVVTKNYRDTLLDAIRAKKKVLSS